MNLKDQLVTAEIIAFIIDGRNRTLDQKLCPHNF